MMDRKRFGYALFVILVVVILASLPLFVGAIDPIYLLAILIAAGVLWPILRLYLRKTPPGKNEENVNT